MIFFIAITALIGIVSLIGLLYTILSKKQNAVFKSKSFKEAPSVEDFRSFKETVAELEKKHIQNILEESKVFGKPVTAVELKTKRKTREHPKEAVAH